MYDFVDILTEKEIKDFIKSLVNDCVRYLNTGRGGAALAEVLLPVCDFIE